MFGRKKSKEIIVNQKITFVDLGNLPKKLKPNFNTFVSELGIANSAQENALSDHGDPATMVPSASEIEIETRCHDGINSIGNYLQSVFQAADGLIIEHRPDEVIVDENRPETSTHAATVIADIADAWNRGKDELTEVYIARLKALKAHNFFKARNKLNRPADYSENLPLQIVTLIAIFIIETVVNGLLFGQVNDRGLIGGWGLAAIISAINVGVGLLLGLVGLRLMFHQKKIAASFGVLVISFLVPCAFFWNSAVAVYRDLAEKLLASSEQLNELGVSIQSTNNSTEETGKLFVEAMSRVLELSISFSSIEGIALFIMGLFIVVIAAMKGRAGFTDPYWGYKSVDLKFREADDDWSYARDDYADEISEIVHAEIEKIEINANQENHNFRVLEQLFDAVAVREKEAETQVQAWGGLYTKCQQIYRDEFLKVRGPDLEAPAYFSSHTELNYQTLPKYSPTTDRAELAKLRETNAAARQLIISTIQQIRSEHINERDNHLREVINNAEKRVREEDITGLSDASDVQTFQINAESKNV